MSITITNNTKNIYKDGWDFPIEELDYLLDEHNGETFALKDNRLFESDPEPITSKTIIIHDDEEPDYILDVITIETNLNAMQIQQVFESAKALAREETGGEWQTHDIIDRLPKIWNPRSVNLVELCI